MEGALNVTVAVVFDAVATTFVGGPGVVDGITALEADDETLVPTEFLAVTVNVYETPFVNPVTVIGELAEVEVNPPGLLVTV